MRNWGFAALSRERQWARSFAPISCRCPFTSSLHRLGLSVLQALVDDALHLEVDLARQPSLFRAKPALLCAEPALLCAELALFFPEFALLCAHLTLKSAKLTLKFADLALQPG